MKDLRRILAVLVFGLGAGQWLHAEPFAYVPRQDGVTVIDVQNHRIVAETPLAGVGAAVTAVAAMPGDSRIYVRASAGRVIALDSRTHGAVATVAAPASLLALNPGRSAVYAANALVEIDTNSNAVVATLDSAAAARDMAVNRQGTRLYVLGDATLDVYDTASRARISRTAVPAASRALALHPTLERAYLAQSTDSVIEMDLRTGTALATIPVGRLPSQLVADAQGTRLFVLNAGNATVQAIDVATRTVVAGASLGGTPQGIDVTPDGQQVFVVNAGNPVVVLAAESLHTIDTIPVRATPGVVGRFIGGRAASPFPDVLTGLWWNPDQSGWGVHIAHRNRKIFAAWFTYDSRGEPKWYVASDCAMTTVLPPPGSPGSASCSGSLFEVSGGRFFPSSTPPTLARTVGRLELDFTDRDNGTLTLTTADRTLTSALRRQVFRAPGDPPVVDFTDLWWDPLQTGWGLGITQQSGTMFLAWFVYDAAGIPEWYVASNCEVVPNGYGCTGELYRTSGPVDPLANPFDGSRLRAKVSGSVQLRFTDANNGVLSFVVDGIPGTRTITRQLF